MQSAVSGGYAARRWQHHQPRARDLDRSRITAKAERFGEGMRGHSDRRDRSRPPDHAIAEKAR
jgi:hypothetical protein